MSRSIRALAVAATALVPSLLLAAPAHAADRTVAFTTTGFSQNPISANQGHTIEVINNSLADAVFVASWGQLSPITVAQGQSYVFTMQRADSGAIVAIGAGVPALVIQ